MTRVPTVDTGLHRLTLYPEMDALLTSLSEAVENAKERIWIEAYIYRDDKLGHDFAELLARAVARGIDVRLLYDALGCQATRALFFEEMASRGIKLKAYRPLKVAILSGQWWPRDHSRIILIDQKAYTGGAAWGDEWLPHAQGGLGWHDVCSSVEGPAVDFFHRVFLWRWAEAGRTVRPRDFSSDDKYPDLEIVADSAARKPLVLERYRQVVRSAKSRVWIHNSYFLPPKPLLKELYRAADRGVDVKIIVPRESDLKIIDHAARTEYKSWLKHGLSLFEYGPNMTHAKYAVIDDEWATVGTFNANPTSVLWANELNMFFYDKQFIREVASLFEHDLLLSAPVFIDHTDARTMTERMRDFLENRFLRFLETRQARAR